MIATLLLLQAAAAPSPQLPGLAFMENEYVACLKEAGKYPRINTVPADASSRSQLASQTIAECAQQRAQVVADWQEHPEKIGRSEQNKAENAAFASRVFDWIADTYRQTLVTMPRPAAPDQSPHQ